MKDIFDWAYYITTAALIAICVWIFINKDTEENACLSKSCSTGEPIFGSNRNCFCAEVPK